MCNSSLIIISTLNISSTLGKNPKKLDALTKKLESIYMNMVQDAKTWQ